MSDSGGWQAEAIITGNKSVAGRIEDYVKEICKEPPMARYRRAVKDYVRVTVQVTTGFAWTLLRGGGRPRKRVLKSLNLT